MKAVMVFYILNATLLLLHEIESAYEREWEILKLPGKITGFLLIHVPIILIFFYALLEINLQTQIGSALGIITGAGGIMPFLVHKIFMKRKGHFNLLISNIIVYANILTGIGTIIFSSRFV